MAFGPMPGGMVKGQLLKTPYFNWGWNYVVSTVSKQPEIAYLFTLYACSPVMSTHAVRDVDGYFDPFRGGALQGSADHPESTPSPSLPSMSRLCATAFRTCI